MKTTSLICIVISYLLFTFFGCSDLKSNKTPVGPTISIHGIGFADTTKKSDPNFHAKYVASKNFDLPLCQSCHGTNYAGGTTGQSCNSCHNKTNGPENCTTCHGSVNVAPPKDLSDNVSSTFRGVGAHQKHLLNTSLHTAFACNECHKVPAAFSSPGHIDATPQAEVRFDTTSIYYKSNAVYSASNVSCANTYCHGNTNVGNNLTVIWTDTSSTAAQCGSCHGDVTKTTLKEKAFPKSGHTYETVTSDCTRCHNSVINSSMAIIDPSKHVNGRFN